MRTHLLLDFVRAQLRPAVLLEELARPAVASHAHHLRQAAPQSAQHCEASTRRLLLIPIDEQLGHGSGARAPSAALQSMCPRLSTCATCNAY